jgi:membrane protein required for colicin V production
MWIDILLGLFLVLGIVMGIWKGLIHSIISFIGLFLGVCVAVKWSSVLTRQLYEWLGWHGKLMPVVSFVLLFILVLVILKLITLLLEKSIKTVGLGWVNRLAGAVIWCVVLVFVLSVLVWFGDKMKWIDPADKKGSYSYNYLQPAAPIIIDQVGKLIPWFAGMFDEAEEIMERMKPVGPGHS